MLAIQLDEKTLEKSVKATRKSFSLTENPALRKTLIEAGIEGIVNALRQHFKAREAEPENRFGFPKFGQSYPKRYFWYGNRGLSVAEQIRVSFTSPNSLTGQVSIKSPALAHKVARNPPLIIPKGGRKYLTIPASPAAAAWVGSARDFPGNKDKSVRHWWFVRRVQTAHDPRALPTNQELQAAASKAIKSALSTP